MANKVSIYAICKNEEQFVHRWLDSMKEADYIVVLDTGSTDNTVNELKSYAKEIGYNNLVVAVKTYDEWRFDKPRNDALNLCPEDTTVYMSTDLDEVLEPGWGDILREEWDPDKHERGVYKYSWSHLDNGESGRIFQYDKIHSKNWYWKYPVHELLWNKVTDSNAYDREHVAELFDKIHLHHYPDKNKSRNSYLPLLELRKKEAVNDYYGLIYLGHEYYYRGLYNDAIRELKEVLQKYPDESINTASCYLFIGDSYKELHKFEEAKENYLKAIIIEPTYREPYINLGKLFLDNNLYDDCIFYIKLGLTKTYRHYTWLERDLSWSYEPYDILSLATYYSGKKRDSLAYAFKAYTYEPSNQRLKSNIEAIINSTSDNELLK